MGTNCAPLVADLFLFCYERNCMLFLSDDNQSEANSKVLKHSLLLLGIWMTYLTLTITSLIAWPIIVSL